MKRCWWLGLLLFWASALFAQSVDDLYQAKTVLVAPQNQAETTAALREAFLVALVRVSGQPNARENKYLLAKAEKVETYVDRYSYHTLDSTLTTADGQTVHAKELTVNFAPRLIDQLLTEAKFAVWKTNRPLILVLVKDEENSFASTSRANTLSAQLQNEFYRRGLSVVLPKMDADDLLVLGATYTTPSEDQWAILQERYHYQAVLMGELIQNNKDGVQSWSGKWQLIQNEHTMPLAGEGGDPLAVITQMAGQVTDALMSAATQEVKAHEWMISVQGIHNDDEYKTVRQYLEHLAPVKMVKFIKLENDTVTYQVTSDVGLEKTINSESALIPDTEHKNTESELYYLFNVLP